MCRFLVAGEDDETPARAANLHRSGDDAVAPWPGPGDSGGADEANEPRAPGPPRTGGSLSLDPSHPAALISPNCGDAEAQVVVHHAGRGAGWSLFRCETREVCQCRKREEAGWAG